MAPIERLSVSRWETCQSEVDADTRRGVVADYLECLSKTISHADEMAKRVRNFAELRDAEREDILLALERDRFLAEADRKWILEKMDGVLTAG